MVLESEDCSRVAALQGTVSGVEIPQEGTWQGSPWHMLQIMWDEPDVMKDKKYISPWQVEVVAHVSPLHPTFRFPVNSGLQTVGDTDSLYPWTGYSNMPMRRKNPPSLYNNAPFGMQGARQDDPSAFGSLHYINDNAPMHIDIVTGNILPKLDTISTNLNVAGSLSEIVTPDSPTNSVQSGGERVLPGTKAARISGAGSGSFQLFGQIIHARHPVENT